MANEDLPEFLIDTEQAAKMLGRSTSCLRQWRRNPDHPLAYRRLPDGRCLYRLDDVAQYAELLDEGELIDPRLVIDTADGDCLILSPLALETARRLMAASRKIRKAFEALNTDETTTELPIAVGDLVELLQQRDILPEYIPRAAGDAGDDDDPSPTLAWRDVVNARHLLAQASQTLWDWSQAILRNNPLPAHHDQQEEGKST